MLIHNISVVSVDLNSLSSDKGVDHEFENLEDLELFLCSNSYLYLYNHLSKCRKNGKLLNKLSSEVVTKFFDHFTLNNRTFNNVIEGLDEELRILHNYRISSHFLLTSNSVSELSLVEKLKNVLRVYKLVRYNRKNYFEYNTVLNFKHNKALQLVDHSEVIEDLKSVLRDEIKAYFLCLNNLFNLILEFNIPFFSQLLKSSEFYTKFNDTLVDLYQSNHDSEIKSLLLTLLINLHYLINSFTLSQFIGYNQLFSNSCDSDQVLILQDLLLTFYLHNGNDVDFHVDSKYILCHSYLNKKGLNLLDLIRYLNTAYNYHSNILKLILLNISAQLDIKLPLFNTPAPALTQSTLSQLVQTVESNQSDQYYDNYVSLFIVRSNVFKQLFIKFVNSHLHQFLFYFINSYILNTKPCNVNSDESSEVLDYVNNIISPFFKSSLFDDHVLLSMILTGNYPNSTTLQRLFNSNNNNLLLTILSFVSLTSRNVKNDVLEDVVSNFSTSNTLIHSYIKVYNKLFQLYYDRVVKFGVDEGKLELFIDKLLLSFHFLISQTETDTVDLYHILSLLDNLEKSLELLNYNWMLSLYKKLTNVLKFSIIHTSYHTLLSNQFLSQIEPNLKLYHLLLQIVYKSQKTLPFNDINGLLFWNRNAVDDSKLSLVNSLLILSTHDNRELIYEILILFYKLLNHNSFTQSLNSHDKLHNDELNTTQLLSDVRNLNENRISCLHEMKNTVLVDGTDNLLVHLISICANQACDLQVYELINHVVYYKYYQFKHFGQELLRINCVKYDKVLEEFVEVNLINFLNSKSLNLSTFYHILSMSTINHLINIPQHNSYYFNLILNKLYNHVNDQLVNVEMLYLLLEKFYIYMVVEDTKLVNSAEVLDKILLLFHYNKNQFDHSNANNSLTHLFKLLYKLVKLTSYENKQVISLFNVHDHYFYKTFNLIHLSELTPSHAHVDFVRNEPTQVEELVYLFNCSSEQDYVKLFHLLLAYFNQKLSHNSTKWNNSVVEPDHSVTLVDWRKNVIFKSNSYNIVDYSGDSLKLFYILYHLFNKINELDGELRDKVFNMINELVKEVLNELEQEVKCSKVRFKYFHFFFKFVSRLTNSNRNYNYLLSKLFYTYSTNYELYILFLQTLNSAKLYSQPQTELDDCKDRERLIPEKFLCKRIQEILEEGKLLNELILLLNLITYNCNNGVFNKDGLDEDLKKLLLTDIYQFILHFNTNSVNTVNLVDRGKSVNAVDLVSNLMYVRLLSSYVNVFYKYSSLVTNEMVLLLFNGLKTRFLSSNCSVDNGTGYDELEKGVGMVIKKLLLLYIYLNTSGEVAQVGVKCKEMENLYNKVTSTSDDNVYHLLKLI